MCPVQVLPEPVHFLRPLFIAYRQMFKMPASVTAKSKAVSLEFDNNINHRRLLKTLGNKRVLNFIILHLDEISGITCLQL